MFIFACESHCCYAPPGSLRATRHTPPDTRHPARATWYDVYVHGAIILYVNKMSRYCTRHPAQHLAHIARPRHPVLAARHAPPSKRRKRIVNVRSLSLAHVPPGTRHSVRADRHAPPGTRHPIRAALDAPPGTRHPARPTRHGPPGTRHPARPTRHAPPGTPMIFMLKLIFIVSLICVL